MVDRSHGCNPHSRILDACSGLFRHGGASRFGHVGELHSTVGAAAGKHDRVLGGSKHLEGDADSMDRTLSRAATGTVEFRGKEQRRIKLELKARQGCDVSSDIRLSDADVDNLVASIRVDSARKIREPDAFHARLHREGLDSFGLWSEFGPQCRQTKVVFKWLPIESENASKVRLRNHVASFKDDTSDTRASQYTAPKPAKSSAPSGSRKDREELKNFLCGGFAGVVSRTAVAPLDLIKTHLITSHGLHGYHKTATQIFLEIWRADGWRGLFRGNGVNCIRVAPCKAIELCTFEIVKKMMSGEGNPFRGIAAPVAGGAAGMAGTLTTYPLELIRTRISLQPHKYGSAFQSILKVINEEGFPALYAGLTPSLLGVFPYAATNYFVYDGLRSAYSRATGRKHVPTGLTLLFGAVAAAASSAVTYPLEVARRQMQLGASAMVVKNSTLEVVRQIYAEEGFLALYRGLGTTWLKLVPAAGISFVCYEAARRAWELEEQRLARGK